jgi:hypothetical protein
VLQGLRVKKSLMVEKGVLAQVSMVEKGVLAQVSMVEKGVLAQVSMVERGVLAQVSHRARKESLTPESMVKNSCWCLRSVVRGSGYPRALGTTSPPRTIVPCSWHGGRCCLSFRQCATSRRAILRYAQNVYITPKRALYCPQKSPTHAGTHLRYAQSTFYL